MNDFSNEHDKGRKIRKKRKRTNKNKEYVDDIKKAITDGTVKNRKRKRKRRQSETNLNQFNLIDSAKLAENTQRKRIRKRINAPRAEKENLVYDNQTDFTHNKEEKSGKKRIFAVIVFFIALLLIFIVYYQVSHVKIPNFVDKPISDVKKWATTNQMNIETKNDYSSKVESGYVIKEESSTNKKIKKGSHLTFIVSQGADPNELIQLPNFSSMTETEVADFIKKNKAENINIVTDSSNQVEKGKFIKAEFKDKQVTSDTYRRKDMLTIYFSTGKQTTDETILIPDFSNKTKDDVKEWAKKNKMDVTYEEVNSNLPIGSIVKSSLSNQYVPRDKQITFEISNGKGDLMETTDSKRVERKGKG